MHQVLRVPQALGLYARTAGLLDHETYELTKAEDRNAVERARVFYERAYLRLMDGDAPDAAWKAAADDDPETAQLVPPHLAALFRRSNDARKAETRLKEVWTHPLDSPVLMMEVLPSVWRKVQEDDSLRFLPRGKDQDTERLQYLRARLSLEELQEQDEFLHWLPDSENWDRNEISAEMHDS
jgi:hypothetical protein